VKLLENYKFESSQKDESRAQSAGSSKAYRKPRALTHVKKRYVVIVYVSSDCRYRDLLNQAFRLWVFQAVLGLLVMKLHFHKM